MARLRPAWIALLFIATLAGAEEITLVTYNLLNFPGSTGAARAPYFRTVMDGLGPDLIVAQEILGQTGVNYFEQNVLDVWEPGSWSVGPYHDGYDTDNALFYRTGMIEVLGSGWLDTALRDIDWWHLRWAATGDEFRVYSLHLKASQGVDNEAKRLAECEILRTSLDALPAGLPFLVVGDFNIYTAAESAYQHLTGPGAGELFDPIDQEGNWHDTAIYAPIHTQSTRTTSFGGGATGGMDDRFDLILAGEDLLDGGGLEIDPATYLAYGNDGNHFNLSIVTGVNTAVPADVANALHEASDHLPVRATLLSDVSTSVASAVPAERLRIVAAPNPFNPATTIRFSLPGAGAGALVVYDLRGREVRRLLSGIPAGAPDEAVWDGRGREVPSGVYFARVSSGGAAESVRLVLVR
ncbi:MAG: endonuclease/exonuclease/phosphatase family protein [Candidatus Eisenbacteria bacterium]